MRITAVETIQLKQYPNLIFVEIFTDEGIVGLGETFRGADSVATQIHHTIAPQLLGADPRQIELHNCRLLTPVVGFSGTSTEIRAASAIDLALWDISGQWLQQPLYQLLGGRCRDAIRVYNTCSGYSYNNHVLWKREITAESLAKPEGPYDDQIAFVRAADELAHSLLEEGFSAMKIWPFDPFAERSGGMFISGAEIRLGLEPFERIRKAVGDQIDIMAEFHSLWNLTSAKQIACALEPLNPYWSEDPIKMVNGGGLKHYSSSTRIPVCASETLSTRNGFRDLLFDQAIDYVMLDLGWCGGLTEAKKICALAETHQRPVAPHDCTGPVVLAASIHLAVNAPNVVYQEVVRAFLAGWYRELVDELPRVERGLAYAPSSPGHGMRLQKDLKKRPDAIVRRTALD